MVPFNDIAPAGTVDASTPAILFEVKGLKYDAPEVTQEKREQLNGMLDSITELAPAAPPGPAIDTAGFENVSPNMSHCAEPFTMGTPRSAPAISRFRGGLSNRLHSQVGP